MSEDLFNRILKFVQFEELKKSSAGEEADDSTL